MTTIVNWNGTAWAAAAGGTPVIPATLKVALIGDSTLYQDGNGQAAMRAGLASTFGPVFFYAAISKAISYADSNGFSTLQNMAQARAALGGEPDVWFFNLGSNGHHDGDSLNVGWINAVMGNVASTSKVVWNGISQADGYSSGASTVATRLHWNDIAKPVVQSYANGIWADWHAYVKARPGGDAAMWSPDGVHNTTAGYAYKNAFNVANLNAARTPVIVPPVDPEPEVPAAFLSDPAKLAGADTIGSASYTVPLGAIFLSTTGNDSNPGTESQPKATLMGAYNAAPSPGTIVARAGEYRDAFVGNINKTLTLQNYPGEAVWFDGSDVVTGWAGTGPWTKTWTIEHDHSTSWTQGDTNPRWINAAYPYAAWPDMLFVDGVRQELVGPTATPMAGQWCHNYDTDQIKLGTNPAGKEIRVAVRERFAIIKYPDTTFRGVGFRRYATGIPQIATIFGSTSGPRATVQDCWFLDCGQQSVSLSGAGSTIRTTSIIRAGMAGIHSANTSGITVDRVWVNLANYRRFNNEPTAAAMKATDQHDAVVKDSVFTNSFGYGVWFDINCTNIIMTGNTCTNITGKALFFEISDTAVVAGNYVDGASYGVMCMNSSNWQGYNNAVNNTSQFDIGVWQDERVNTDPATKTQIPWIATNTEMANNVLTFKNGTSGHLFQTYALDRALNRPAEDMVALLAENLFSATSTSPLESSRMIGWGGANSAMESGNIFKTPAAFQSGVPKASSWVNFLVPESNPSYAQIRSYDTRARPMPANVAAALGVPAGTKVMGPPRPAPQIITSTP